MPATSDTWSWMSNGPVMLVKLSATRSGSAPFASAMRMTGSLIAAQVPRPSRASAAAGNVGCSSSDSQLRSYSIQPMIVPMTIAMAARVSRLRNSMRCAASDMRRSGFLPREAFAR